MYFKKFLFILIISFIFGLFTSYFNKINGTIIVYPKFNNINNLASQIDKEIYLDDNNINYYYTMTKIN